VFDPRFAEGQVRMFEEDKKRARRITLEEWQRRPWRERALERVAVLIRLQL
jgi:cardiolipin synthase